MSRIVRRLGIAVGIFGTVIALLSIVMGMVAKSAVQTIAWMIPEVSGLVLVAIGLHAWIDWSEDE